MEVRRTHLFEDGYHGVGILSFEVVMEKFDEMIEES
jgi:hypothetical protein